MSLARAAGRILRTMALAVGTAYLVVTAVPVTGWIASALAGGWDTPKGDVLVLLTGSLHDERTIGLNSYWRAVAAAKVFREDGFSRMLISGGGVEKTPIAVPTGEFAIFMGVPREAVRLETGSNDTHQSALRVGERLRELGAKRVVLMTSDYHMFRALRAFRKVGVQVAPRPIPDVTLRVGVWWLRWETFIELLRETAKIVYYAARGWI